MNIKLNLHNLIRLLTRSLEHDYSVTRPPIRKVQNNLSECWRPRRDLNPCYRRESDVS